MNKPRPTDEIQIRLKAETSQAEARNGPVTVHSPNPPEKENVNKEMR